MASKKTKQGQVRQRSDVQDGDWEKQLQDEKRRCERLQAEMGSGLTVRVRRRRVRQEWSQASAQFWGKFCRLMGTLEPGLPSEVSAILPDGPTFISSHGGSLAGTSMVRHRVSGIRSGLSISQSCAL